MRCRPAFPQEQEKPTNADYIATEIKPRAVRQIMHRRQEWLVFTMAHSYLKSTKSLPGQHSPIGHPPCSKKPEPTLPRGLGQESFRSSASKLSSILCVLSKNFHTESSLPITPGDNIKMIGKNRPSFLVGQPKHTVPQGERRLIGISRGCDVFLESSGGRWEQCHQTGLPRKPRGEKHMRACCDMGFPGKGEGASTSP